MTVLDAQFELARRYGYSLRVTSGGMFLFEIDRNDPKRVTDDLMLINNGQVDVYAHDASAYFVARQIANLNGTATP